MFHCVFIKQFVINLRIINHAFVFWRRLGMHVFFRFKSWSNLTKRTVRPFIRSKMSKLGQKKWWIESYKIPVDRYIHVYICTSVFSTVKYPSPGDPWPLDLSVLKFYQLLEWAKSFSLSTDQALIRCPVNEMELLPIAKTRQTILPSATALTRKSLFKKN